MDDYVICAWIIEKFPKIGGVIFNGKGDRKIIVTYKYISFLTLPGVYNGRIILDRVNEEFGV